MRWITAADITRWAETNGRQCQEKLPELVRRLIQATAPSIQRINFPCDSSVNTGGWDGHLETDSQSPHFPVGFSKWELSSHQSPGVKADGDYDTRKKDPSGAVPTETTYVAVTTRQWPKRSEWESSKKADGYWKDVRVIAADELEQWLAVAPGAAAWFARLIGKSTPGVRDLQAMWEAWTISTNPALTPDIVIAGRLSEKGIVQKWVMQPPGIFEMQGDSPEEPFAFLYASIATLPSSDRDAALARAVVIDGIQQLRDIQNFTSPLIIAAPAECIEEAHMAARKGHHVFLSMDAQTIDMGTIRRLSRPLRDPLQKALQEAGMSDADAQRNIRDFGASIPVLRRHLFRSGVTQAPSWANADSAEVLLPILLSGAWDERIEGDKSMIESMAGMKYGSFLEKITPLLSVDDAPLRKVGSVWKLKSPLDAWFLVAPHLDQTHFERFRHAINAVLTETNPKYDLPPDQRWAAGLYDKSPKYSEWIRRGLIESLVLLAVYGERISPVIETPQAFASSVVRDLLEGAETWESWASLKDVMSLLAEASPDAFLDILEEKIEDSPAIFTDLMRDEGGKFGFDDCHHSGLLWALEGIAWDPEHLINVVRILDLLVKLDPGGKWSNRPLGSLIDILLPGIPQTNASPSVRVNAFDMLMKTDPNTAWKIAESHMGSGTISASHSFRWRDTGGSRSGLDQESRNDYFQYVNALLPKWAEVSCATNENILSAVDNFIRLADPVRDQVVEMLKDVSKLSLSVDEQRTFRHHLRDVLNWINNYDKENKFTPFASTLRKAYEELTPTSTIERIDWLFADGWPRLPDAEQASKNHEEKLVNVRKDAARDLLDNLPLTEILDYGETLNYQGIFSSALAKAVKTQKEDSALVRALAQRVEAHPWLLVGYSMGSIEEKGEGWVIKTIGDLKKRELAPAAVVAALLRGLPENIETWKLAESYGDDVDSEYWKLASGYSRTEEDKTESASIAVKKLVGVGRPEIALNIAGDSHISLPSKLLQKLLTSLLELDSEKKKRLDGTMLEFYLTNIFNQIYERKELSLDEIGKLEWPFAQVFDRFHRRSNQPMALHRTLQENPGFFVELVSYLYKKDDGTIERSENVTEEQMKTISENAYEVLGSWSLVPGLKDGVLEEDELMRWVKEARKIAESKGYLRGCDLKLAEILSRVPPDKDGMWPHKALRNTLEEVHSSLLDKHIPYAIYNSRGVRNRSLQEGGSQERKMAETYAEWSKAMQSQWPRTSKVLKFLSGMFDNDARREDVDLELRDLEF